MIRSDETTVRYDLAEAASGKSEVTFSYGVCQQRVMLSYATDWWCVPMAEIPGHGGPAPVVTSTVAESRRALARTRRAHDSLP